MSNAKPKVLLLGWDAADWKVISPLLEAGEMPHLEKFINGGVMGNLATLQPMLSPMLWTSIATGVLADRHGILGFTRADSATDKVRPFGSMDRKVKALWNILSENGFQTHVINWFSSHPAQPINGVYVSDLFAQTIKNSSRDFQPQSLPAQTVHPTRLSDSLAELRVAINEIDSDQIGLFVRRFMEVDQSKDPHLGVLAMLLAECFTIHSAVTWTMENEPWDFMAAHYGSIDHFSHGFMKYHPPRQSHIGRREFELYSDVVNSVYRLHDLLLGRLLHLAGENTTVILCSDHGYRSDHLRPRVAQQTIAGAAAEHRPIGILAMRGPNVKQDELVHGASIIDITPTVLHLFGLPVGRDMAGRPLLDALVQPAPVETILSWEKTEDASRNPPQSSNVNPADYDALLKQFVALGYMPGNSGNDADDAQNATLENQWNLARVYLDSGRLLQALPLLEEVYEEWPLRLEIPWLLADCQFRIGLKTEAAEVIKNLIAIFPDRPMAQLCRAVLEYEQGNIENALTYLKALELRRPAEPTFYNRLGLSSLRLNRIEEARRSFARTREIEPDNAMSFIGESRCLLRLGKNEEAAQNALLALGVNFSLVAGHYYLGMALARLGELDRSLQAFETCLRFNPGQTAALRCLIRVCAALPDAEKEKHYRELYQKNSKTRLNPELRLAEFRQQAQHRAAERKTRRNANDQMLREDLNRLLQNDSSISQTPKTFVIVSGLPRSGTSLMMQLLQAGGIPPMTDQRRQPDLDNPEGYFEWEAIKEIAQRPTLIEQASGKAVKVISMLLPKLPRGHHYKIIFMDRPVEEIAASQSLMLQRNCQEGTAPQEISSLLQQHRDDILRTLERAPEVEFCVVNYPALIENPTPQLQQIRDFLGDQLASPDKMQNVIRPELYRNRAGLERVGK